MVTRTILLELLYFFNVCTQRTRTRIQLSERSQGAPQHRIFDTNYSLGEPRTLSRPGSQLVEPQLVGPNLDLSLSLTGN